jgi:putative endonuclease
MLYTVYVLFSPTFQKIYIGYTSNLIERFKSHNQLSTKGWTRSFRPWLVIYNDFYETKNEALRREKNLKSGRGREWIWSRIKNQFSGNGFISE